MKEIIEMEAKAINTILNWIEEHKWWTTEGSLVVSFTILKDKLKELNNQPEIEPKTIKSSADNLHNEKILEVKSLDIYFPKGKKKRGEAMVVAIESFLKGKEQGRMEKENKKEEKLINNLNKSIDKITEK